MSGQSKKSLNIAIFGCYISLAITVLMAGRENPLQLSATTDAASVFFVVATFFALERQIMARCVIIHRVSLPIPSNSMTHCATMSMVAQAGPFSNGPVSDNAGILTPVWAIASERENSSDSITQCYRRLPSWLQPQQKNTQNPRSPNSATTAAVRFTVRRWWLSICIFSTWTAILKRCSYMFLLYCPTSTTILRL
ncbi:hypothetical protein BHZ80_19465 [Salmonella enterica]|nr:hypothetical protein [Salmonella enterica]EAA9597709.1 hypothetical protein [Salmonella enterica]EAO9640137.1 hypothetical protein [Salmonella enterica]EKI3326442.1 ash family protein [Salmonella enterica]